MSVSQLLTGGIVLVLLVAMVFAVSMTLRGGGRAPQRPPGAGAVRAPARILDIRDTGNRFNRNPEVRLTLEVRPAVGSPFQTELTTVVSVVDIPRFQPGSEVIVAYEAEDRTRVAIAPQ